MSRWLMVFAALGFASCRAHQQVLPARAGTAANHVHQYESGLRLVVEPEPGSKRVAMALLVGAGSAADPPGREGLSYALARAALLSRPDGVPALAVALDRAGVVSGDASDAPVSVGRDCTTFKGTVRAAAVEKALPLMASLLVRPLEGVGEAELAVERSMLLDERFADEAASVDSVEGPVAALALARSFPGNKASTPASLAALTLAELEALRRQAYRPDNAVVALVGDVTPVEAQRLMRAAFPPEWLDAPVPVAPRERLVPIEALRQPRLEDDLPTIEGRVAHQHLFLTWSLPGTTLPAGAAMPSLRTAVAFSLERVPGVRSFRTTLTSDLRISFLGIDAELEDDAQPEEVLQRLRALRLREPRLGAWQVFAVRSLALDQDLLRRATQRAQALFLTGAARPLAVQPTPEQLTALKQVEQRLVWSRAKAVVVVPRKAAAGRPPPAPFPLDDGPVPEVTGAELDATALGPPLGEVRRFTLANGLNVLLSRRPSLPVASVALGLPVRAAQADRDVAAMLPRFLFWGLDDAWLSLGRPSVTVGADATVAQLTSYSVLLPLMLDLLSANLPPQIGWHQVENVAAWMRERKEEQEERERGRGTPAWKRLALPDKVMPPGSSAVPVTLEELQRLERGRFVDFVDSAWRPNGAWLVVDGDLDLEPTERLVRKLFGDWQPVTTPPPPERPLGPPPTLRRRVTTVYDAQPELTKVQLACRVPGGSTDAVGGGQLVASALREYLAADFSRELGRAYLPEVTCTRFRHEENLLTLTLELDDAHDQAALRHLVSVLDARARTTWTEQQLARPRLHLAKERTGRHLTSMDVTEDIASAAASGVPLEEVLQEQQHLAQASLKAVNDAWASCVATWYLQLTGDSASLDAATAGFSSKRAGAPTPLNP